MNKVTLTGRLARDPEMRYTTTGKAVCSFTLAVNRRKDKDGNQTADFIPCQAWEKLAEVIGNNCVKGSPILVEGRIQVRSYDAQDGSKKYITEVIVHEMEFMGGKPANAGNNAQNNPGGFEGQSVNSDDIPF